MKLRVTLVLAMLLVAGILTACGGGNNQQTPAAQQTGNTEGTTTPTQASSSQPTTTSVGSNGPKDRGAYWSDVPIYPEVNETIYVAGQKPSVATYTKMEQRVFQTQDSVDKVAAFYKTQLAANGWEGGSEPGITSTYTKDGGKGYLLVSIVLDEQQNMTQLVLNKQTK